MDRSRAARRSARRACRPSSRRRCGSCRPRRSPGLITTRSSVPAITPAPSAPRMRGFGTDGSPLRIQTSRWFSDAARSSISTSPSAGSGIGHVFEAQNLRAAVLVDANRLHRRHNPRMNDRRRPSGWATSSASTPLGVARAEAYEETERHIRRAPRAWPVRRDEVHDGAARDVLPSGDAAATARARSSPPRSATGQPEAPLAPGHGRLARYTWDDALRATCASSSTRSGVGLGGAYRVLVDANQHVDREAAARSGVGFYGKNTMLITRRHGSWVVLGTLVTDVELEPTPPLDAGCGECRLCIDACPTGALDEPGTLDATKCLSYWTQAPAAIPEAVPRRARRRRSTAATSARTSARGIAASSKRRDGPRRRRRPRRPRRLARGRRPRARRRLRPALRPAQRAALAAAQRARRARQRRRRRARAAARAATPTDDDPSSRSTLQWALDRVRSAREDRRAPLEWWIGVVRLGAVPFALLQVSLTAGIPPRDRAGRLGGDRRCSPSAARCCSRSAAATTSRV